MYLEHPNLEAIKKDFIEEENVIHTLESMKRFDIGEVSPNGKKLIISDCDECLVNITLKWFEIGKEVGLFDPSISIEDVINRKKYYISDMMLPFERFKPYLKDKSIKCTDDLALKIYDTEDFYDDLILTKLGNSIKMLLESNLIDLVIISHTTPNNKKSKEKFLKDNFPTATLFLEDKKLPKSYIINKFKLNGYTSFVDDDLRNIYDVILNTNSIGKEFIIPKFGYNDLFFSKGLSDEEISKKKFTEVDKEMLDTIEKLGCSIVYVEPI